MEATTRLQKARRTFPLRLVAEYGPREASRILRALAVVERKRVAFRDSMVDLQE